MADNSRFKVDISDDFHQKVMQMIDSSGVTPKEWFEKVVGLGEIHDLNEAGGDHKDDYSELEALTARINELAANMTKREIRLKDELATKIENIASITASLENSNKEIAQMRASNEEIQSLIGALRSLVAEQEMQLKDLKEVIGTKEQVITSFVISLEKSKKEIAELHKKVDEMKANNESKETLIGEYKEKLDSLSGAVSLLTNQQSEPKSKENSVQEVEPKFKESSALEAGLLTNQQSEPKSKENSVQEVEPKFKESSALEAGLLTNQQSEPKSKENSVQEVEPKFKESSALEAVQNAKDKNLVLKAVRKAQIKTLKKLLKKNPNAEEKVLAEQLGVDSSFITELRKELDI
ncbi:chromosome segregation ATPase [Neobacillus niacini]|uniref:hypothetical protein n=1 Tax=Neobacillus niacini TaxID=86668 RepID=UPI0028566EF9|nr:hypothetical protein [Neobacillus niacini]MDR7080627.1 chromosome segregation ATPase [Neobacillus niacini]